MGGLTIDSARLVVVSGLPGTGKTTLSRMLVPELRAAYLRVDVVETPLERSGVSVGVLGYEIVCEVARSNLELGVSVVVDLVNPLPITRQIWKRLAAGTDSDLVVFECYLPDEVEHRRRVQRRKPDLDGQVLPTWEEVVDREYSPWDDGRDGVRVSIDMTDRLVGLQMARTALNRDDCVHPYGVIDALRGTGIRDHRGLPLGCDMTEKLSPPIHPSLGTP